MRHATIVLLAGLLLAAPAQGQEPVPQVLYCVDEGAAGFKWDEEKGKARYTRFTLGRFTVKIVSGTKRIISWAEFGGRPLEHSCLKIDDLVQCRAKNGALAMPIIFGPKSYTRAYLAGRLLGSGGNIYVVYGTCSKF